MTKSSGVLAVAILAVYLLGCEPYFRGQLYRAGDLNEQFLPWRLIYALSLERGELGVWNPFFYRGYDHHAEGQGGLLHPVHLLAYTALPVSWAIVLEMALIMPFAGLGMFILLRRRLCLVPIAAVFGAGQFGLSTIFYAHFVHINLLWVWAHAPWLIAEIHSIWRGKRPTRATANLALLVASMLLLGHPQMMWMSALAVVPFVLVLTKQAGANHRRHRLGLTAAGVGIGMLIGAVQLIPTADALRQSPRGNLSIAGRQNFSLHPLNLLTNVNPFLFADKCVGDNIVGLDDTRTYTNSLEFHTYLGWTTLVVIYGFVILCYGHRAPPERSVIVVASATFVVAMVLSLGRYGGLSPLLSHIPLIGQFRAPVRYNALAAMVVAITGAYAIHQIATTSRQYTSGQQLGFTLPIVVAGGVAIWGHYTAAFPFKGVIVYLNDIKWLLIGPALATVTGALMLLAPKRPLVVQCLCIVCVLDLAAYTVPILRRSPMRDIVDLTHAKEKMATANHRFRHVSNLNAPVWDGHYLASGYAGIPPTERLALLDNRRHLQLASARYAHAQRTVFVVPNTLPRVRLVPELRRSATPWDDVEVIDLAQTALCAVDDTAAPFSGPAIDALEQARIVDDGMATLHIRVDVKQQRLLVVSDRWSPDWRVYVDGIRRPLIPLFDNTMRGVIIDQTDRNVVMSYVPTALWLGGGISMIGVLALGTLFVWERRQHRKVEPA